MEWNSIERNKAFELLRLTTKKFEEIQDLRAVILCKRILDFLEEYNVKETEDA